MSAEMSVGAMHVSDDRFVELSLGMSLTMAEEAHLDGCVACAARLAEENDLSALLGMADADVTQGHLLQNHLLQNPSLQNRSLQNRSLQNHSLPSADFVTQTVARYERARGTQEAVRVGVVLAMASIVGAIVSLFASVVLAPRIPHLLGDVLHAGIAAAKFANAGAIVASRAPMLATAVMMMATMTVALLSATLLRLYSRHERVVSAQ